MKAFGGMISVVLRGGLEATTKALESFHIFALAESLGAWRVSSNIPAIMITHPFQQRNEER